MQAARLIENSAKPPHALESWASDKFAAQPPQATERDELLLLATERFCSYDDHQRLGLEQYKEAFYSLVSTAGEDTLAAIARKLSTNAYAPREVVLYLAAEHTRISEPILRFAPLLSQLDMVQLIEQHDNKHSRLLATRPDLGPAIVKRLMRIEDAEVREAIAKNRAVTFNAEEKAEFEALLNATQRTSAKPKTETKRTVNITTAAKPVAKTAAKPKFVVSVKRNGQKAKAQPKPAEQNLLAAAARGGRLPQTATTAANIASQQDTTTKHGDFAKNLEHMALTRNHQGMATLMKKRFNLAMDTCREVLEDESGDTLAVLLSAANVDAPLANRINLLTFEPIGASVENARRAIQFYASLDQKTSLEAVEQWPKSTLFTPRHEPYLDDADRTFNRGENVHESSHATDAEEQGAVVKLG